MESETKVYIGIDPGKGGAITYLFPSGDIESVRFPVIGKEYDVQGMAQIFEKMSLIDCHVAIEDVKALQKPMQAGNWSLSRGKTILEVLCHVYKIPHTLVHSKTWQKVMWQGVPIQYDKKGKKDTKSMALIAAKRLYPSADLRDPFRKTERAKAPQDGVVDSLLIAGYAKRNFM